MTKKHKEILFKKILTINKSIFPYLMTLSFFFMLLESYMYIGFLRKFILVDSRFFLVLSILSIIFIVYSRASSRKHTLSKVEDIVLNLNALLFFPLLVFYLIMIVSNSVKYQNYIFTTFHIQPQNFFNVVILSFLLFVLKFINFIRGANRLILSKVIQNHFTMSNNYRVKSVLFIVIYPFTLYIFINLFSVFHKDINNLVFISTHINYSYDQKMEEYWGFYYDFIKFVKDNTPENSVIVIPPQETPWLTEGNEWVDRYFLYPRKLVQGTYDSLPDGDFDYVMVAWGTWNTPDKERYGWPKVNVKAEKIIYINSKDNAMYDYFGNYDPKDQRNQESYGLIEIKK